MIKSIVLSFLALAVSLYAMTPVELQKYKDNELLKSPNIKLLVGKKIDNDYALIKGYIETPNGISPLDVITNNKIVISGGVVYDSKTKKRISLDIDYSKFKKEAAFTIGNGKTDLYLFTEAECPYCTQFEDNLKNLKSEYKLHVFMFPLEQIHYLAKDMSLATLSQPKDKRAKYYKKIMELKKTNMSKLLEELEKYNIDVYKKVAAAVNSFGNNSRAGQMAGRYISFFEKRENKKFNSIVEVVNYCNKKIKDFNNNKVALSRAKKVENILNKELIMATVYFKVEGTPSLFDMNGNNIRIEQVFNK
jgi:thiol:disulfide interchange protein DsbC